MHAQLADAQPFLLFLAFGVIAVVVIIIGIVQAAKRRQAWSELSMRLGCSFSPSDPFGIDHSYPHSLFKKGFGRRAYNVIHGEVDGREIKCFDYLYKERSGTGKNRRTRTYHFTALLLTPPIPFQYFWLRPESFLDRFGEFVGLDDIDFESDEFSRRFYVKCKDKRFAYDIIHARVMELLLGCGKIHIEAEGMSILMYYSGSLRVPEQVEKMVHDGVEFLGLIPDYVLEKAQQGM